MLLFRNKFAAHTDPGDDPGPIPQFDLALEATFVYDELVRDLIAPDQISGPTMREVSQEKEARANREVLAILGALELD